MGLKALWLRWFNRPTARRPRPAARTRLAVECLEGRELPATFTAATVPQLIGAITAANQSPEADTISLAPGKTFTLTAVNNGASGLPVITAEGGSLTIVGNGDVIERSAAKGTPAFRLIDVAFGATLTLDNLTLQGGYVVGTYPGGSASGGGIANQGSLTLKGVTVQNNTARGADGVNSGIQGGHAFGGGISSGGVLTVQDSIIRNNVAIGGRGGELANGGSGFGGGLQVGAATLLGTTITGNTAKGGAAGPGSYWAYDPFEGRVRVHASDGDGYGGGINMSYDAYGSQFPVYLDAYTVNRFKSNHATYLPNIGGHYTLLS